MCLKACPRVRYGCPVHTTPQVNKAYNVVSIRPDLDADSDRVLPLLELLARGLLRPSRSRRSGHRRLGRLVTFADLVGAALAEVPGTERRSENRG